MTWLGSTYGKSGIAWVLCMNKDVGFLLRRYGNHRGKSDHPTPKLALFSIASNQGSRKMSRHPQAGTARTLRSMLLPWDTHCG